MWCPEDTMADHSQVLFNKTPMQLRLLGARGGRAFGRNQRARRALRSTPPKAVPTRAAPGQTTAEAIAVLDTRFPWLSGWGGPHKIVMKNLRESALHRISCGALSGRGRHRSGDVEAVWLSDPERAFEQMSVRWSSVLT
jgi:hypothetical protein